MRMAVSSVGQVNGKFAVCLENGLVMETRGLVIAAPARYSSHMLYSLQPDVAALLLDYQYDPVARVSLGYQREDAAPLTENPDVSAFKFVHRYDNASRVPAGHVLMRVGTRLDNPHPPTPAAPLTWRGGEKQGAEASQTIPDKLIETASEILASWGFGKPVMTHAFYWPGADPLTRYLPEFSDVMDAIDRLLPPGVALVGSDYRAKRLDQQVDQGRAAARMVTANLR
jgi:protoporphyrinogen oxidase